MRPRLAPTMLCPQANVPEQLLIARAARGERRAAEQLIVRHQQGVSRLVSRLLGWQEDVDDVVQDVFCAALRALPRFRGQSAFGTWLTTIAVNTCRTHRRRRMLRLAGLRRLMGRAPRGCGEPAWQPAVDREVCQQVRAAIDGLPGRDREVIVLRYFEERPVAQIAEIVGSSAGAVEVRLSRARRRLAASLGSLLDHEP